MNQVKTYIIGLAAPDIVSVRDFVSLDTRSREIGHRSGYTDYEPVQLTVVREYASSNGTEYFISIEDQIGYLYGFTRLCLPTEGGIVDRLGLGQGTAMIRELHVYGQLATLADKKIKELKDGSTKSESSFTFGSFDSSIDDVQHTGLGRQLMSLAEQISITKGYHRLSVISGVGVRGYYQKLGYDLIGTYMVKDLAN